MFIKSQSGRRRAITLRRNRLLQELLEVIDLDRVRAVTKTTATKTISTFPHTKKIPDSNEEERTHTSRY
jgi:hypothetical protein